MQARKTVQTLAALLAAVDAILVIWQRKPSCSLRWLVIPCQYRQYSSPDLEWVDMIVFVNVYQA